MSIMYEAGAWLYKMLITFVCAFLVVALIGSAMKPSINTIQVQRDTMRSAILYSPDGLAYRDSMNAVHPGIIDLAQFNTVGERLSFPQGYGGARLQLRLEEQQQWLSEAYIAKTNYEMLYPPIAAGIKRSGSIESQTYPVQIRNGASMQNGYLTITIVMPYKT